MDNFTSKDLEESLSIIASMISKTGSAKEKFTEGSSQYTLLANRLNALNIAYSLISIELEKNYIVSDYTKEDYEKSIAPITSLISKSLKAQNKLVRGTWQHTMLNNNIKALNIALPLLMKVLNK
jgi:hypothetical protein